MAEKLSDRTEALAGITTTEAGVSADTLTQWLNEGVSDTYRRMVDVDPGTRVSIGTAVEMYEADGTSFSGSISDIISVFREVEDGVFKPCTKISSEEAIMASDDDSLYYRSKFNPGWYLEGGTVRTVPAIVNTNGQRGKLIYAKYTVDGIDGDTTTLGDNEVHKYYKLNLY